MKPVAEGERIVVNINDTEFEPFINDRGEADGLALQLDRSKPLWSRLPCLQDGTRVYHHSPRTSG